MELLGRFELPTSSLPTDSQPSECLFPALLGSFCSGKSETLMLSAPLIPSASFAVWVRLWVKHSIRHMPHWIDPSEFHRTLWRRFGTVLVKGDGHASGTLQFFQFLWRESQLVYKFSCQVSCVCHSKHLFQNWWPTVQKSAG